VLPDEKSILDLLERVKGMLIYLPVLIAVTCGLRRGEICALRWQDMDWETGRLHVRHSLYRETGAGLKLKSPKNKKGRPVALPASVLAILKQEFLTRYPGNPLGSHGDDYICAWEEGRPMDPRYVSGAFEKLGLPITFHGLRHSHDTMLFRHKVDSKLVADRSGRDEALTQEIYEHVLPDQQDQVAKLIDKIFFKTPKKNRNKRNEQQNSNSFSDSP
jgi:integrase